MNIKIFLYILFCLVSFIPGQSQLSSEIGLPRITNYTHKDYEGSASNWSILQDKRGLMYFGNSVGVLVFDGINWEHISLPHNQAARALSMDEGGRIYLTAGSEFGYLTPDKHGRLKYKSLRYRLEKKYQNVGEVWDVLASPQGVFFKTRNYLIRLRDRDIRVWEVNGTYRIYRMNNRIFVRNHDVGLMEVKGDSLVLLPGGEKFATIGVYDILPYRKADNQKKELLLITTATNGLFIYNGKFAQHFAPELDSLLIGSQLYDAAMLSDSTYAIGTQRNGLIQIDRQGNVLQIINKNKGLHSSIIYYVYPAKSGGLWLALGDGIARIDLPSPISLLEDKSGLEGYVYSIRRHKGKLYLANDYGVRFLVAEGKAGIPPAFHSIADINKPAYKLFSLGSTLFVLANNGFYQIKPDQQVTQYFKQMSSEIHPSRFYPETFFVTVDFGIAIVRIQHEKLVSIDHLPGFRDDISTFIEVQKGMLWVVYDNSDIFQVQLPDTLLPQGNVPRFKQLYQHRHLSIRQVTRIKNQIVFFTNKGLKKYDSTTRSLIPSSILGNFFADSTTTLLDMIPDSTNRWYILYKKGKKQEVGLLTLKASGNPDWQPLALLKKLNRTTLTTLFLDKFPSSSEKVLWVGTNNGLVRLNLTTHLKKPPDYHTLIRKVVVNNDSLIYGGFGYILSSLPSLAEVVLPYKNRNLDFHFSSSSYSLPEETLYRTRLENFDEHWSPWHTSTRKSYTNLPAGDFRFQVQAKDISGKLSHKAVFAFTILPPWYQSGWAYALYAGIILFLIFLIDRVQRHRLIKKERERAKLREIELFASEAEARSMALQAENDRRKNVELFSEIGKEITSSLDLETIYLCLYRHISKLVDVSIFEIGIYHPEQQIIEFKFSFNQGKRKTPYTIDLNNHNRLAVWSIINRKPIFIADSEKEYTKHLEQSFRVSGYLKPAPGELTARSASIIYFPLIAQDQVLGVLNIQSFKKNAYSEFHTNVLQNLASYTTIALYNALTYRKLNETLQDLKKTQEKLIIQEKLALLGALTAGIAHEIKNPLNFITNFAELSLELVTELEDFFQTKKTTFTLTEQVLLDDILNNLGANAARINKHGKRADSIVRSMLEHSRGKSGERRYIDVNKLLDEALNLAYHGMRAQDAYFNVIIEKHFDETIESLYAEPQKISRVFINIISNSLYEMAQKKQESPSTYEPLLHVESQNFHDHFEIHIKDNGRGIPVEIQDKLFHPFFTTKPAGSGTGLGLSLSHDIVVKEYQGNITFLTKEGEFTKFTISLPKMGRESQS